MIILYQLPCDLLLFGTLNLLSAEPEINQCSYTFLHNKIGHYFRYQHTLSHKCDAAIQCSESGFDI